MRNFWLLSVLWLWTCSGGGGESPTEPEGPTYIVDLTTLQGQAQKGPFNNGTSINIAELTNECDLDGVVCASTDVKAIKNRFGKDFLTVTPGIRPNDSKVNDQNRISTPFEAVKNGSDYLVIGRPITESEDPTKALEKIIKEIL